MQLCLQWNLQAIYNSNIWNFNQTTSNLYVPISWILGCCVEVLNLLLRLTVSCTSCTSCSLSTGYYHPLAQANWSPWRGQALAATACQEETSSEAARFWSLGILSLVELYHETSLKPLDTGWSMVIQKHSWWSMLTLGSIPLNSSCIVRSHCWARSCWGDHPMRSASSVSLALPPALQLHKPRPFLGGATATGEIAGHGLTW